MVHKFGGTSLADARRLGHAAGLVEAGERPALVVVSALGGVTELLAASVEAWRAGRTAELARCLDEVEGRHRTVIGELGTDREAEEALRGRLSQRMARLRADLSAKPSGARAVGPVSDAVLSAGEDLSAPLMVQALRKRGVEAVGLDAREVVATDDLHGAARPRDPEVRRRAAELLVPLLEEGRIPVIQGFVGATGEGEARRTTTLGRGGSDLTASLLGWAVGARSVHVWTDVDGILSADPRAVDGARILERLGFEEAVELAYFGAKVLHPEAAKHAVSRGVPLWIRNTFRPGGPGTRVLAERWGGAAIAAVAHKPRVTLVKVRSHPAALPYGFLARVFGSLARHRLPVDLVATSHSSTAFTLHRDEAEPGGDLAPVVEELEDFAEVEVIPGLATVTVVGHGLLEEPGIDALVFETVGTTPIHLISQASDVSLSLVVDDARAPELVRRLHDAVVGRPAASGPRPPNPIPPEGVAS